MFFKWPGQSAGKSAVNEAILITAWIRVQSVLVRLGWLFQSECGSVHFGSRWERSKRTRSLSEFLWKELNRVLLKRWSQSVWAKGLRLVCLLQCKAQSVTPESVGSRTRVVHAVREEQFIWTTKLLAPDHFNEAVLKPRTGCSRASAHF